MALRDTQDVLIFEVPSASFTPPGHLRVTQDVLIFEYPVITWAPPYVAPVGFTPLYPPIEKQPFGMWGMEAKRADSITVSGIKRTVFERIDTVTTLNFPWVALSDMPAWKAFEAYALTGGPFTYRPILDYPNIPITNPMFQSPGTDSGDDTGEYSVVELLTMDWTPKFKSPGIFSLAMKLKLVEDA